MSSSAIVIWVLVVGVVIVAVVGYRARKREGLPPAMPSTRSLPPEFVAELSGLAQNGDAEGVQRFFAAHEISPRRQKDFAAGVYAELVKQAVADDVVTESEEKQLENAQRALTLSEEEAERIVGTVVMPLISGDVKAAMADRRVTDAELKAIEERAKRLKVSLSLQGSGVKDFDRYIAFSRWERGELPLLDAPIALKSGEQCHFSGPSRWLERRVVKTRVSYSGFSASVPIVKGVRYRVGTLTPVFDEKEVLHEVDSGTLVLTSQRVVFLGRRGAKSFPWKNVLSISPYSDAIEFARSSGKHPIFPVSDPESLGVMSAVLLADA